jgi:hypothetical protein
MSTSLRKGKSAFNGLKIPSIYPASAIFLLTIFLSSPALTWEAQCSISGKLIEIEWPQIPNLVARNGNHEIQYRFQGENMLRLGEVTGWLSKCFGRYCPTDNTKTFELNTFSDQPLLYCFPLEQ